MIQQILDIDTQLRAHTENVETLRDLEVDLIDS